MKYTLLFAVAISALAQTQTPAPFTLSIDAGSPSDRFFTGGTAYGAAQQADLAKQVAPFSTLRYGAAFSYEIPVPPGICSVRLSLFENRSAAPGPTQSAIGTRLFTVSTGSANTTVDIFALAGAQAPYTLSLPPIAVKDGKLHLTFVASRGNASVSALDVQCQPAVTLLTCRETPTGAGDCTGLLLVDILQPDGSHKRYIGAPAPDGFVLDPLKWTPTP